MWSRAGVLGSLCFVLLACGGGGEPSDTGGVVAPPAASPTPPGSGAEAPSRNLAVPDRQQDRPLRVLMIGNSHAGGVSPLLRSLLQLGLPGTDSTLSYMSVSFLDEAARRLNTLQSIEQGGWTHVILQGQKYSQSWTTVYPTTETETLLDVSKAAGSMTVLYPEHPQRGNNFEGQAVYELHLGIAARQASCVAPVGPVWNRALAQAGTPALHHRDGNHANDLGSLLTAYVLYQVLTGQSATSLPEDSSLPGALAVQAELKRLTADLLGEYTVCPF